MTGVVIAKYAPGPMSLSFAVTLAIFVLCWFTILHHPPGTAALDYAWTTDKAMVIVTFLYTPVAIWRWWAVLGQVIYHDGRAVWIENGRLVYLPYGSGSSSSLPVDDVQNVSIAPGGFLRPSRIAIRSKEKVEYVTPFFFSGSAEAILARLSGALALAKS